MEPDQPCLDRSTQEAAAHASLGSNVGLPMPAGKGTPSSISGGSNGNLGTLLGGREGNGSMEATIKMLDKWLFGRPDMVHEYKGAACEFC
jgi:hypothetical protein